MCVFYRTYWLPFSQWSNSSPFSLVSPLPLIEILEFWLWENSILLLLLFPGSLGLKWKLEYLTCTEENFLEVQKSKENVMVVPLFTFYIAKDKNEIPQPSCSFLGKAVLLAEPFPLFKYFEICSTNTLVKQKWIILKGQNNCQLTSNFENSLVRDLIFTQCVCISVFNVYPLPPLLSVFSLFKNPLYIHAYLYFINRFFGVNSGAFL